jgi:hypothetical protein
VGGKTEILSRGRLQIHVIGGKGDVEDLGHCCSDSVDIDSVDNMT